MSEFVGKKKKLPTKYNIYKIFATGLDCKPKIRESAKKGRFCLVEDSMVEDFVFGDLKMKIVQENYVVGVFVTM
jgi:hypothetical protein